jgi:hypothetical protein
MLASAGIEVVGVSKLAAEEAMAAVKPEEDVVSAGNAECHVPVEVEDEVCTSPPRAPEEGVVPVDVGDQVCTSPP